MNSFISSKYDDYIILYEKYQCELSNITCIDLAMNECVNMKANYTVGLFTEEVVEKIKIYFDRIQVINLLSYSNYDCHVNFTKVYIYYCFFIFYPFILYLSFIFFLILFYLYSMDIH